MKTLIVPASWKGTPNLASERMRCDWMLNPLCAEKYDGSQTIAAYDLVIYQKSFPETSKPSHQVRILDTTDPLWRFNDPSLILHGLETIDIVTCSSVELANDFKKHFPGIRCEVIPDRHDFGFYEPHARTVFETDMSRFVWFGYAETFGRAETLCLEVISKGYDLITISEKAVGLGSFVEWNAETWLDEIAVRDVAVNPLAPSLFKASNHKHVTAWALGLPVVETEQDIDLLLCPNTRRKEVEYRRSEFDRYDIKHSADEIRKLYSSVLSGRISQPTQTKSVYCTIPNGSGWIHKSVHFAVCKILGDPRYRVRHDAPTHTPYIQNLHKCMWDFLNGGEDYWLSFDDDNPPTRNPLDLVELDCDVIGCPTPVWSNTKEGDRPFYLNALDAKPNGYAPHEPCEGLQEVDAIGSGCFLVSRRVMEALKDQKPFARQWGDDGLVTLSGDFSFSRKVKAAGFSVWAHFDYVCDHYSETPLLEVIMAFGAMRTVPTQGPGNATAG